MFRPVLVGISSFWIVLLVRRAILMSAFLKMFIIKLVSLPKYVKGAHVCVTMANTGRNM